MISIIAAIGQQNELGKDNQLPWYISDDLKRFKKLTSGHSVIMGRKTFDSINNKSLPNRRNIVLTKEQNLKSDQFEVVHSLDEALKILDPAEEVFVIGGAAVYNLLLPVTNRMYLTIVHKKFNADVYFPEYNINEWVESERIDITNDPQSGLSFSYITLDRVTKK
jgi:dihydrofolate reductase